MHEEKLKTQDIYNGRIIHLQVHEVRLPDGNTAKRETLHHQGAVAVIALDAAQHILLVKQYRIGAEMVTLELPAGLRETDEDPAATALRELREETGYTAQHIKAIGGIYTVPGYSNEYVHLYYATQLQHDPLPQDADEFVEVARMPFTQALQMIDTGEINEAKTVVGLLRVARLLDTPL